MKSLVITLLLAATPLMAAAAPSRPYHLQLEANAGAPFPFMGKFGSMNIDVFRGGVRVESLWLNGFSRNGSPTITIENPLSRMYTEMPVSHLPSMTAQVAHYKPNFGVGSLTGTLRGKVGGIDAIRYRLSYGPQAWIDVWTTDVVPANPQLRAIVGGFVRGISPATGALLDQIPGTPLYVEMNFSHYPKLPIVKLRKLVFDDAGEQDALSGGSLYFKAPLPDSIWK